MASPLANPSDEDDVGGVGNGEHGSRMLGLRLAGRRGLVPVHDAAVAVELVDGEDQAAVRGQRPALTAKSWYCSGATPPPVAVQVICDVYWVTVPSSVVIGFGSAALDVVIVQPSRPAARARPAGCALGRCTTSFTKRASALSFGAWKVSSWKEPGAAVCG